MTATKTSAADVAAKWNATNPVGTPVLYWPEFREGPGRPSRTRTPAWVVGDHSAVVSVDGYPGGIALTHITVLDAVELHGEVEKLRADLAALLAAKGTVTEYGVLAWSKHLGEHHVDACDDYESALSTLRIMWRKVDAGAQLVSRQVPAPGPVGKWLPVSPDDAAAALETVKAAAR
ncbi:hypothetical protein [Actinomadura luteofluorescens]|uniref:hypothetical protein n=1 Tax=Actinomadura luteofluorescens TaxID=46163 RepID=UPI003D9463C5